MFSRYECTLHNQLGTDSQSCLLSVGDSGLAAGVGDQDEDGLMVLVAACVCAVLAVAAALICAAVVLCRRRRKQRRMREEHMHRVRYL